MLAGDLALLFMVDVVCAVSWNFDSCFEYSVCVFMIAGKVVLET